MLVGPFIVIFSATLCIWHILVRLGVDQAMKIDVDDLLVEKCNSCFTIMMGVLIENNEVYLCSLEEASGKTLCHIDISVKGLNIELADRT